MFYKKMRKLFIATVLVGLLTVSGCGTSASETANTLEEPTVTNASAQQENTGAEAIEPEAQNDKKQNDKAENNEAVAGEDADDNTEVQEQEEVASQEINMENAVSYAKSMRLGWNLGNTLDAIDGSGMNTETSWGMPKTTKEIIQFVKDSGFTTIRIPVSWHNHMTDGVIDEEWLNRVQQVVDWALEADLIVILNSHHDNDAYYPATDKMEDSQAYLANIWTQIAARFQDYDEKLIFAGMNEPRLANTDKEWWFNNTDPEGIACIENVNVLNQTFIDTVRAGEGYNKTRFLMISCAIANPEYVLHYKFELPEDTIEDHIMIDVHAYTPYDFTMNDNGYSNWDGSKKGDLDFMGRLRTKYIMSGYGVVIGEFGATNKNNLEDRCAWAADYCGRAASLGIPCILWDNGQTKVGNENFGMIDRNNLSIYYPELLDAYLTPYRQ